MISIKVNGLDFLSKPSISILEACQNLGIFIPRFCYHELLSISGNCRMCLVEVENLEKPVASCVTEVEESMSIIVDSPFAKKARENVVELLLLNHPLDCPICDQAGECDLQDQTKTFGSSHSRYFFSKKSTEDKYCGPLIQTIMTRCIKCTRCVRYADEISGNSYFGTLNRGVDTEIGSYVLNSYESEISGNVVDLCPVGALTAKPYAFSSRPWELRSIESIDTTDSLGANIYINYKESEIFRILPKNNSNINGSLISDKTRYSYDSNNTNRIKNISIKAERFYKDSNWSSTFIEVDNTLCSQNVSVFLNQDIDVESLLVLKDAQICNDTIITTHDMDAITKSANFYVANQSHILSKINNTNDAFIFLGANLKFENALLNARVRSKIKLLSMSAFALGSCASSNFPTAFVHLNIATVMQVFEGKCSTLSKIINEALSCLVFVGSSFVNRVSNFDTLYARLFTKYSKLSLVRLYQNCNSDALRWLNIQKLFKRPSDAVISINPKDNFVSKKTLGFHHNKGVFIGTHSSSQAIGFNIICPAKTVFESRYIFCNLEHRSQETNVAINTTGEARDVSKILTCIFSQAIIKSPLWSDHIKETAAFPDKYNTVQKSFFSNVACENLSPTLYFIKLSKYPLKQPLKDFHISNRALAYSKTLLSCSKESHKNHTNFV